MEIQRILAQTPSISIIIPARNAEGHLGRCLKAVFASNISAKDVIVVDDGSSDDTAAIAKEYPCTLIRNEKNKGTSYSRNAGADKAQGDILVFVDSDILIRSDTLSLITSRFEKNPDLFGINGLLDTRHRCDSPVSQFVNLSIHYQHQHFPDYTNAAFTSIFAIRRKVFIEIGGFSEEYRMPFADDVNIRFKIDSKKPLMLQDRELQVEHLKQFNLWRFCSNRFQIGFHYARSLLAHARQVAGRPGAIYLHSRYPFNVLIITLLLADLLLMMAGLSGPGLWGAAAFLVVLFIVNNLNLLRLIYREKGLGLTLLAIPLTFCEALMYLGGLAGGLLSWPLYHSKKKQ